MERYLAGKKHKKNSKILNGPPDLAPSANNRLLPSSTELKNTHSGIEKGELPSRSPENLHLAAVRNAALNQRPEKTETKDLAPVASGVPWERVIWNLAALLKLSMSLHSLVACAKPDATRATSSQITAQAKPTSMHFKSHEEGPTSMLNTYSSVYDPLSGHDL